VLVYQGQLYEENLKASSATGLAVFRCAGTLPKLDEPGQTIKAEILLREVDGSYRVSYSVRVWNQSQQIIKDFSWLNQPVYFWGAYPSFEASADDNNINTGKNRFYITTSGTSANSNQFKIETSTIQVDTITVAGQGDYVPYVTHESLNGLPCTKE
jgi:hypothetical protein